MIKNLPEKFLYERLPSALIELDEQGIILAVVSGYQDRLDDLRSYARKFEKLYAVAGLPEPDPIPNVVLVDLESDKGKTFTRSLDILDDAPGTRTLGYTSTVLTRWAAAQLGLEVGLVTNVRYGRDLLRRVDANVLDYLAVSIGCILYQTNTQSADELASKTKILESYFPRLKIKGTAASFEVLGRILGFEDIRLSPQWGRISSHLPSDPGSGTNVGDFLASPEYFPRQDIGPFYNPHKMDDGPFYSWAGTCSNGTASTQFYTQVVNSFNPWVDVIVTSVAASGTITHPADGSYVLGSSGTDSVGGPHKKAHVRPAEAGVMFQAIAEGASFNGLTITVASSGANKLVSISDRLSAIKYRSSYFDLGLTSTFETVEEVYGSSAVHKNKDLAVAPHTEANYGTAAVSPYRPWRSGSITTGLTARDFLTQTGTQTPQVIVARVQASGTDRELNTASFLAAGAQVVTSLEEVRPATRFPLRTNAGFLVRDPAVFAAYGSETVLFSTISGSHSYSGTATGFPLPTYIAAFALIGTNGGVVPLGGEYDPTNGQVVNYRDADGFVLGTYYYGSNAYNFFFTSVVNSGTQVKAFWTPTTTEVVRPEPTLVVKRAGTVAYQKRPEDDMDGLEDEVADEYPWRRDLVVGGELVETDTYITSVPDVRVRTVDDQMAVADQTGAEYNVYGIDSPSGRLRLTHAARPTDEDYAPGQAAIAFSGELKDLAVLTQTDTNLVNTKTDAEILFEPGFALYHAGLVQGVVVADAVRFFGSAHRNGLACWVPFNEHVDDDLEAVDRSALASDIVLEGVLPPDRRWDDQRGWHLNLRAGAKAGATKRRGLGTDYSLSFWIKPDSVAGTGVTTVFRYGPVTFDLNNTTAVLTGYVLNPAGSRVPVMSYALSTAVFNFISLRGAAHEAVMGYGTLAAAVLETYSAGKFASFGSEDETFVITAGSRSFGLHDFRVWNINKTPAEIERIRYHQPVPTVAAYRIGFIYTLNRQDRYALRALPSGFVAPDVLTAWLRTPALQRILRYDSLGRYHGETRFKETGLGGGRYPLPDIYKLGQQFYNVTGLGETVTAPPRGAMPGMNYPWRTSTSGPGMYLVENTGSTPSGTIATEAASGTSNPWPNYMVETNPNRHLIWVKGDDGFVYELKLESIGAGTNAGFTAERVVRSRSDAELELNRILQVFDSTGSVYAITAQGTVFPGQLLVTAGTTFTESDNPATGEVVVLTNGTTQVNILHPKNLRDAEQPTGAEVWLAGTGTILSVKTDGSSVYIKPFNGTFTTPPLWMYLDNRVVADVADAYTAWTEAGNTSMLGETLTPKIAARSDAGLLEFTNSGTLVPGFYRLTLESGNIGKVDRDFDGFRVEININETILQRRLLAGQHGFNIRGTDEFEFELVDGVTGEWLLSLDWLNDFDDPARGARRQLAVFSYTLRRLQTELYKVTLPSSGTLPQVDFTPTEVFYGSIAGGWLAQLNSYGSVVSWRHESKVYSANDTVESRLPLSDVLTSSTEQRRSDIIVAGTQVVVADGTTGTIPFFGTLLDAAFADPPVWMWCGGITPNPSVQVSAKVVADSPLLQLAVDTDPAFSNPVFSDYATAATDNNRVVKFVVNGLSANSTYYYAIANAGSIYKEVVGQFVTFSAAPMTFSFAAGGDVNNTLTSVANGAVFDTIRSAQPLFLLHLGDLHYNSGAQEPTDVAAYRNCYDQIFIQSDEQNALWRAMAVVYQWDDNDYGPPDSDGTWAYKASARQVYREYVPSHPLAAGSGNAPTYFAFTVGRCRFVVTDCRSERSPNAQTDDASKTMLGAAQKAWFKQELLAARGTYPIIFWVSTVPWSGAASVGADGWSGFATERVELNNFIKDNAIQGIFVISADMHALAADDGTNTKFATGGTAGLPVFQCAPLLQTSDSKGAPYLLGPTPGAGVPNVSQWALITVTDNGVDNPLVRWSGRNSVGTELLTLSLYGTQSPKP